jgi:carboxyl-terminal processing protease
MSNFERQCVGGTFARRVVWDLPLRRGIGRGLLIGLILAGLQACGGGGGGSGSGGTGSGSWTPGVFQPASSLAAKCASPRSGTDPTTHTAYPDVQGSTLDENNWLRSWTNELYLWYREVPDLNPASYTTTAQYFPLLKTSATTASGSKKDKFHFTYPTSQWEALSQSGVEVGYGVQWVTLQSTPPRSVVVAYTQPGEPAATASANLARGASVLKVDGVDLVNATDTASVNTINAGLSPSQAGETHVFSIEDPGSTTPRTVTLQAAAVTSTPVQNVKTISTATGPVGYMLFNDHIATAEQELIDAVNTLKGQAITDLVLDIRYNGGGYLDIASELAYMIAGPGPTAGQTFEQTQFNDKHPTTDPVTGAPLAPTPFHTTTQGFSATAGQPLPTLNLMRVFVLTGHSTCSASESIINSLRGVNVQVIQVGSTTCGKPYGFYPADNCGTTYFSIQFRGVNAQGFGDYGDGFSPANTTTTAGVAIPGCAVADDFSHALGDAAETRLSVALSYRLNQACSVAPSGSAQPMLKAASRPSDGIAIRSPLRENRILRR